MNEQHELDRLLTAWLTADAPIREPEPLLDRVLTRTARTRRRATWRIPERWFPVSTITSRVAGVQRFPWRAVTALAILVLALVVGAVLIAGSRARAVPAPFGPAGNGHITYSVGGDILSVDAPGGTPRTLIAGGTVDSGAIFSRDGTHIIFVRGAIPSTGAELWAADADGSNPHMLAATPKLDWPEWSPRSDVVAVSLGGSPSIIRMVRADGGGSTDIDTGLSVATNPIFRPSDGQQMAIRGQAADGTWGIYLIDRNGAKLTRLDLDPGFKDDPAYPIDRDHYFVSPAWSPDGTRLMYHTLEPDEASMAGAGFRIHVADVSSTGVVTSDRKLEFDRSADDEFHASWLPSGDGIVFETVEGTAHRLMVADVAPGSTARDIGLTDTAGISYVLSPDGREVISSTQVGGNDRKIALTDLVSLKTSTIGVASDDWSWQRTAQ